MALLVDDLLACAAGSSPDRPAVTLGEASLTFAQLRAAANRCTHALAGLGVASGDRVCWWSDMDLDGVALYFGITRLGAAFVPLNPAFGDAELAPVLAYLRPRLLVADVAHAERAAVLAGDLGLEVAVASGGVAGGAVPGHDLDRLVASASPSVPSFPPPAEEDVATIFLTSGSTGRPKG
ncbi:MAG: AMP-binding protein, partial [Acidimicrobiales bacterium]